MKTTELRQKSESDLTKMLKDTKTEIEKYVSDVLQGKAKNTNKTRQIRKGLARIKTVLNEKKVEVKENA